MRSALTIETGANRHSLLAELLRELGFPLVVDALSIETALERAQFVTFDVIFIEVEHTVDPGFDFIRQMRFGGSDTCRTPIIVVCGNCSRTMVTKTRDSGANGLLIKPFSRASVGLQVVRALNHKRPFIRIATFAGPDRRRWCDPEYRGPERRSGAFQAHDID
jgi:CheY-like chemotaxis protein